MLYNEKIFADDQLLIAQDYEDLEYMTRKLIFMNRASYI